MSCCEFWFSNYFIFQVQRNPNLPVSRLTGRLTLQGLSALRPPSLLPGTPEDLFSLLGTAAFLVQCRLDAPRGLDIPVYVTEPPKPEA